jgi:hypothetical protein
MGLWDLLKNAVVETTPDVKSPETSLIKPPDQFVRDNGGVVFQQSSQQVIDPMVKQQLKDALTSSSPKTWTELQEQIITLKTVLPDEPSAYKAAIALFGKKGIGHDQLLQDATSCIDILDGKKQEFDKELDNQIKSRVGGKQQEIESIDNELKSLQAKINDLISKKNQETIEISAEKDKISQTQNKFVMAYNLLKQELMDEKTKIQTYGKT